MTVSWQPPAGSPPASRYVVHEGGRPVASTGGTSATVIASADPLTGTVGLRWTQPAGDDPAIAYRLYRGAEVVATATGTELAVRLPMATTQVLTVAAVNAAGLESAQSAPLTVRVPYLPPP